MSDKKRKAAPAGKEPSAKQKKLAPTKQKEQQEEEKQPAKLQDQLVQQRSEEKETKFNKMRLRILSDTEKMKQGSEGVLYWMSRDQRVQGKQLHNQH